MGCKPITIVPPSRDDFRGVPDLANRVGADKSGTLRVERAISQALSNGPPNHLSSRELDSIENAAEKDFKPVPFLWCGKVDGRDVRRLEELTSHVRAGADVQQRIGAHVDAINEKLLAGEVVGGVATNKEGEAHERYQGLVKKVSFAQLLQRFDPATWSLNLARRRGGQVKEIDRYTDSKGRDVILLQERMSIDRWLSNLDMTKKTVVQIDKDAGVARINWQVYHSDNATVQRDDGFIELRQTKDGILITTDSIHKVDPKGLRLARTLHVPTGPESWAGTTLAKQLGGYFTEVIERYRDIARGERTAVTFEDAAKRGEYIQNGR